MHKKILMLIPTGVMAMSLFVGGGTYAYFTSAGTSTNNIFSAGTLTMSASRDDIPIMFIRMIVLPVGQELAFGHLEIATPEDRL